MLAYVFWHWRKPSLSASEYEARQRAFHDALLAAPPAGFVHSYSHALTGAAWANGGGDAYEDWYVLDGSAALDALNQGAISASRRTSHDLAAAASAGGTAGLYSLRLGAAPEGPSAARWFAKPDGMRYETLLELCSPLCAQGAALFMRHMVLGPSPEFCLQSEEPVALPPVLAAQSLTLRPVWPPRVMRASDPRLRRVTPPTNRVI